MVSGWGFILEHTLRVGMKVKWNSSYECDRHILKPQENMFRSVLPTPGVGLSCVPGTESMCSKRVLSEWSTGSGPGDTIAHKSGKRKRDIQDNMWIREICKCSDSQANGKIWKVFKGNKRERGIPRLQGHMRPHSRCTWQALQSMKYETGVQDRRCQKKPHLNHDLKRERLPPSIQRGFYCSALRNQEGQGGRESQAVVVKIDPTRKILQDGLY